MKIIKFIINLNTHTAYTYDITLCECVSVRGMCNIEFVRIYVYNRVDRSIYVLVKNLGWHPTNLEYITFLRRNERSWWPPKISHGHVSNRNKLQENNFCDPLIQFWTNFVFKIVRNDHSYLMVTIQKFDFYAWKIISEMIFWGSKMPHRNTYKRSKILLSLT